MSNLDQTTALNNAKNISPLSLYKKAENNTFWQFLPLYKYLQNTVL